MFLNKTITLRFFFYKKKSCGLYDYIILIIITEKKITSDNWHHFPFSSEDWGYSNIVTEIGRYLNNKSKEKVKYYSYQNKIISMVLKKVIHFFFAYDN